MKIILPIGYLYLLTTLSACASRAYNDQSSKVKGIGDVASLEQDQSTGLFTVTCVNGEKETNVTADQIAEQKICVFKIPEKWHFSSKTTGRKFGDVTSVAHVVNSFREIQILSGASLGLLKSGNLGETWNNENVSGVTSISALGKSIYLGIKLREWEPDFTVSVSKNHGDDWKLAPINEADLPKSKRIEGRLTGYLGKKIAITSRSIFAQTVEGLAVSRDDGSTWTNRTAKDLGFPAYVPSILGLAAQDDSVYVGTSFGVGVSRDEGATFSWKDRSAVGVDTCDTIAVSGKIVFCGTRPHRQGAWAGDFSISVDGGENWKKGGSKFEDQGIVAASIWKNVIAYAGQVGRTHYVEVSGDRGASWERFKLGDGQSVVTGISVYGASICVSVIEGIWCSGK